MPDDSGQVVKKVTKETIHEERRDTSSYDSWGEQELGADLQWRWTKGTGWSLGKGHTKWSRSKEGTQERYVDVKGDMLLSKGTYNESASDNTSYNYRADGSVVSGEWHHTGSGEVRSDGKRHSDCDEGGKFALPVGCYVVENKKTFGLKRADDDEYRSAVDVVFRDDQWQPTTGSGEKKGSDSLNTWSGTWLLTGSYSIGTSAESYDDPQEPDGSYTKSSKLSEVNTGDENAHTYADQLRGTPTRACPTMCGTVRGALGNAALWPECPNDVRQFWEEARTARLFEDERYGQWGLEILDPKETAQVTEDCRTTRERDFGNGDLVVGRFLGDSDLLLVRCDPAASDFGCVLVALPLDPRPDWYRVVETFAAFLDKYVTSGGRKFWTGGGRA